MTLDYIICWLNKHFANINLEQKATTHPWKQSISFYNKYLEVGLYNAWKIVNLKKLDTSKNQTTFSMDPRHEIFIPLVPGFSKDIPLPPKISEVLSFRFWGKDNHSHGLLHWFYAVHFITYCTFQQHMNFELYKPAFLPLLIIIYYNHKQLTSNHRKL